MIISLQVKFAGLDIPDDFLKMMEGKTGCKIVKGFSDDADIVVFAGKPEPGSKTVFMQSVSAGVNHLDFKNIHKKIVICSNADAWSIPVAEHAIALILAKYKNICESNTAIRNGNYNRKLSESIYGQTIGIMGYGGIGREVAIRAKAFGMHTIGFGRTEKKDPALDVFSMDSEYVAKNSDVILISLPLNIHTRGMIDYKFLSSVKGNIIVNVGRSEIVNRDDMIKFLKENKNKWFLTDVWWGEPEIKGEIPENVIITPHVAGLARNFMQVPVEKAFENVVAYIHGNPRNIVNRNDYI
jgi:phosphoglycerate dehydrogenase-like enzyme